jgi:hypothetical protein
MPVIPGAWEANIRRKRVPVLGKSKQDPISTNKQSVVVHICNPSYSGGVDKGDPVRSVLIKVVGDVAQVLEPT